MDELQSSTDKQCHVNISNLANIGGGWMLRLPVFANKSSLLLAPEWNRYLTRINGGMLVDDDFPIDLRCFLFWWLDLMPTFARDMLYTHMAASVPGGARVIIERGLRYDFKRTTQVGVKVDIYGQRDKHINGEKKHTTHVNIDKTGKWHKNYNWAALSSQSVGFADNTRIEVYHDGSDCHADSRARGYVMP